MSKGSVAGRTSQTAVGGKVGAWLLLIGALFVLARYLNAQEFLRDALAGIQGLGPWGYAVFVMVYILATVLFLPGSVLTLGAGFVFGVILGSVLVSVASTLGATAAFLVGRHLVRGWVSRQIEGNAKFRAIDEAVAREGWKIVGLTRLSPVFPFNLLNYAFGVTRVSLRDYTLASWIGMMPGTFMYVYIGSLAGDLATLGAGPRARTPAEWALYVFGLAATVAVTIYVTRLARGALQKRIDS
ncbi:MAG: TVP38/TMEM64 family protein [candidate division NC10 bacterium]|nr:TVP38/TMEM64 family protein [candidate division NC10 bacterium]MBI2457209.1 TVP38/TMEM64 family protein [candidate division NC10 bacterium]